MPNLPAPEINVPLLRKTLEHITDHPEEWNQGVWVKRNLPTACGTAACLAGNALAIAGYEFEYRVSLYKDEAFYVRDGRAIDDVAMEELGLTPTQARLLFDGDNTLRDLWELASRYTNGEVEIPNNL